MIAHEYKHFSHGGTGLRSLLDTYIFIKKYEKSLDWDYINSETANMGISDYERKNRELALKVFDRRVLTDEEKKLLNYYIFSGTYGILENKVKNDFKCQNSDSLLNYYFHRVSPPLKHYKVWYPWAYKHKILIPVAWLYRPRRGIFKRRNILLSEFKYLTDKNG